MAKDFPEGFLKSMSALTAVNGEPAGKVDAPLASESPLDADNKVENDSNAFIALVTAVLKKNRVATNNNPAVGLAAFSDQNQSELALMQEVLGFYENIEAVIMDDWHRAIGTTPAVSPQDFVLHFVNTFHNVKVERVAPKDVQERNRKLIEAFYGLVETIKSLQGGLDDEDLRKRIESDEIRNPFSKAILHQYATLFCILSVGYDQTGVCTLTYSLDYEIQAMVPQAFINKFLRRIFNLTPGGMGTFVRIGSLRENCAGYMQHLINEARTCSWHSLHMVARQDESVK